MVGLSDGDVNVTIRQEVGFQTLDKFIDLAEHHAFALADDWESESNFTKYAGVVYPAGYMRGYDPNIVGSRVTEDNQYMDNPFAINKIFRKNSFKLVLI